MERQAFRRRDGGERGVGAAGEAEIVAMHVQRMRHAELVHRALQRLDDGARGDAVERHHVVEREFTQVGLEGDGAAGVDHLDAERARGRERPGHVVAHRGCAPACAHEAQQVIVVAQHRQGRLVDDRNVGELEVRVQGVVRRHRRLDHGGEAHAGVAAAGREGPPARVRQRRRRTRGRRGTLQLRHQQPRRIHVAAGDVGMNVDRARHHDLAGGIVGVVGPGIAGRRIDDAPVAEPDIADAVPPVGGIDDAAALDPRQHGDAPANGSAAAICEMASATEIVLLGAVATTGTSVPLSGQCSTASWSVPGRPTSIWTRGAWSKLAPCAVSAIIGTRRFHRGGAAR
jgi:hypothetical protein